jgi:DNA-binding NarL/FixJ family response regulator
VVIAEDSVLLREGIASYSPDVAVVDVRMPPTQTDEGARAAAQIRDEFPGVGVLLLSQVVEAEHALRLFRERPEGFGYLLKDRVLELEDFVDAVRRVARGGTAVDPEVVSQLLGRTRRDDPLDELTDREREVLALMAEGRSNQGIGRKLFLSPKTVETHVHRILTKLAIDDGGDDNRRVLAVLAYLGR